MRILKRKDCSELWEVVIATRRQMTFAPSAAFAGALTIAVPGPDFWYQVTFSCEETKRLKCLLNTTVPEEEGE